MPTYLPNTSLTALSIGSRIFAYAQGYHGELIEAQGQLESSSEYENVYYSNGQTSIGPTTRWRDGKVQPRAPKMFTPIAAASIRNTRYLIYLNDDNILHDVVWDSRNSEWKHGTLSKHEQVPGRPGVRCAPYSKLTAATVTIDSKDVICVYHQTDEKNGPIPVVSFIPEKSFIPGPENSLHHDLDGSESILKLLWQLRDPPLYGTSLAAVKPRPGIAVAKASKNDTQAVKDAAEEAKHLPVVYLQWDTNALAQGQGTTIRPIPGLEKFGLSPHTSLTVVDDGSDLYCFYITKDNSIQMIRIDDGSAERIIDKVASPTPRSAIAAVMPLQHKNRIVLFYQVWDKGDSQKVDIKAQTFSKTGLESDNWSATVVTNLLSG